MNPREHGKPIVVRLALHSQHNFKGRLLPANAATVAFDILRPFQLTFNLSISKVDSNSIDAECILAPEIALISPTYASLRGCRGELPCNKLCRVLMHARRAVVA